MIRVHWKNGYYHKLFVDFIMTAFSNYSLTSSLMKPASKILDLIELTKFKISLRQLQENQASMFIMHYINHLEEYDNFEKAANFATSKVMVDKFNL